MERGEITLWPHQKQAEVDLGKLMLGGSKAILVASPTGAGKTLLQQRQIEQASGRVAHYSNRRWLLKQTSGVLDQQGIKHGIRMAGEDPLLDEDIQLCSVQTELHRVYKNKKWNLHDARLAIVDEAHLHGTGTSYRIITDHLGNEAAVVGYTATPLGLGHVYDDLVVAGTNSELRACKAHLPCYVFACGELDASKLKRTKTGEYSIKEIRKSVWTTKIFGHVIRHHQRLNPELKPAIGFAPGVPESMWLAEQYCRAGIPSAHIDGQDCWVDGEFHKSNQTARDEIVRRWREGDIKIVWNRFVMREGLDFPWLYHLILATPIGSLTSYIQTTGRVLRYWPDYDHVLVQDHGGNWWRHGSPNENRDWHDIWHLDPKTITDIKLHRVREGEEKQPIECPKCGGCRLSGRKCRWCGFQYDKKKRIVIQSNGTLKQMSIGELRPRRRRLDEGDEGRWKQYYHRGRRANMTFTQLEALWAKENNWVWPVRELPMMPKSEIDWFRHIQDVPKEELI